MDERNNKLDKIWNEYVRGSLGVRDADKLQENRLRYGHHTHGMDKKETSRLQSKYLDKSEAP